MFGCKTSEGFLRQLLPVLMPMALILALHLFHASARADTITLTGGQVVLNSNSSAIGVELTGPNFSLQSSNDFLSPLTPNRFVTCTLGCGADFRSGSVTFNGITVSGFVGSGTFTESTITGSVTLLGNGPPFGEPPFPITVNYVGAGVISTRPGITIFTVSSPVPEPGTLMLFGTGLVGTIAAWRRRRGSRNG